MSTMLHKIGRVAYDRPWYFIATWVVILAIVLTALGLSGVTVTSDIRMNGTESQAVLDTLAEEMPEASGGQGSVVFLAPSGESLTEPERAVAIRDAVMSVYSLEYVIDPTVASADSAEESSAAISSEETSATDEAAEAAAQAAAAEQMQAAAQAQMMSDMPYTPLLVDGAMVPGILTSADGSVALFQFQFTEQVWSLPDGTTDSVLAAMETASVDTGITVLPGESLRDVEPPMGLREVGGIVIAAIVLVVTLGSLTAAGLPVVTALIGVGIGVGGAYALSAVIALNSMTPVLALMIGLAVGIDYALFVVNRQRRLIMNEGLSARDATARAVGTAGSAVFFAGLTVVVALCGLAVIGIDFLTTMALVAAATVLIAVFVAITLLPALLGLVGEKICSQKARDKGRLRQEKEHRGFAHRWVSGVVRFRWVVIAAVVVLLGVAAIPMTSMELGMPSGATANEDSDARQSYDAIAAGFGEGFNGPLVVVVEPEDGSETVDPVTFLMVAAGLQSVDGVSSVLPVGISDNGAVGVLRVIPESGPSDVETKDLVETLRSPELATAETYGVTLGVTGITAITIDTSERLADVFPLYVGVVLGLSLIILLLVFRSIAVPVKAAVGFLLSILATFGLTTAVFQWGWLKGLFGFDVGGPLISFIPIIVTGILFGLAMDYEVFLVSSMREAHVHGKRGSASVITGYEQNSRVVTAAAVIMASIFAGFIFGDDVVIKQVGFALAAGVIIDAFIVRMTLVPAVIAALGERTWWLPKWLDRLLPNLDVEGDKLMSRLREQEAGPSADAGKSHRSDRAAATSNTKVSGEPAQQPSE